MSNVEIKPHILELSKDIKKDIKVNKDGSVDIGDGVFADSLTKVGLTQEDVKKVQKHTADMLAAIGLVVGEQANPLMKKDDKLDRVSGTTNFGRDKVTFQYDRTRTVTNMQNPEEPITQYGALSIKFKVQGTKPTGNLNAVRQHLMQEATKAFGG